MKCVFSHVPEPPSKHSKDKFSPNEKEFDDNAAEDSPTGSYKLNGKHKAALEDTNLR